jgi:hypothetical protein
MVPPRWLVNVEDIQVRDDAIGHWTAQVEAGREFKRGCRDIPRGILLGNDVDYASLSIGQKMHVVIELADDVRRMSERDEFNAKHSTNLFGFINEELTWEEAVVFTHLLSKTFNISFTRLGFKTEQFLKFADTKRHYLRGSI